MRSSRRLIWESWLADESEDTWYLASKLVTSMFFKRMRNRLWIISFFGLLGLLSFFFEQFRFEVSYRVLIHQTWRETFKNTLQKHVYVETFETGSRCRCCLFLLFLMLNFADWFGNFQLFPFQLQLCFSRAKQSSAISFLKASKASRSFKLIFNWIRKLVFTSDNTTSLRTIGHG